MTATAERLPVAHRRSPRRPAQDRLVGVTQLVRLVLRRDRTRLAIWVGAIVGIVVASEASITGLYDTQAELDQYGALVRDNAALIVQAGPGYGLDDPTTGAVLMNELSIWTIITVAVMSIFMTVRHTRGDEETERAELVRAAPIGRHARLAATLLGVFVANAVIAIGVVLSLLAYDLPTMGSLAFGSALLLAGVLYAGVAAVSAQVASSARSARALAGAVLAASFVVRAVGDVRGGTLSWLSPLGWAQGIRAYADERWWVHALTITATVLLVVGAVTLEARRDFGAGLVPQRPGRASAAPSLRTPLALAVRLQRGALIGWIVGVALISFFYGIVADQAESIIEDNPDMADFFAQLGQASITDAFLATSVLMLALTASGFTIASMLRLRTEEAAQRADFVLATATTRARWVWSHALVAAAGTVILMVVVGASLGAGLALMTGDLGHVPRLVAASAVMVPAMLVLASATLAICGLAPRWSITAWGMLAVAVVIGLLATLLKLPHWLVMVSPFTHVPPIPAAPFELLPLLLLGATAALITAIGLGAYERRDIS